MFCDNHIMNELIEKLEKYRDRQGISKADMSLRMGANSNQHYNNWVYRGSLPKKFYEKALELLKNEETGIRFNHKKDGPADNQENDTPLTENVGFQNRNVRRIPLVSFVRAGSWDEVMDPYELEDAEDWIDWPYEAGERAYVLRIEGLSMFNPRTGEGYPDKCQVKFEPDIEAKHGDDVVIRTPDGKVTFKTLQITTDGQYLEAINPDWPERIIKIPEGSVICGVADGHFTPRRRR